MTEISLRRVRQAPWNRKVNCFCWAHSPIKRGNQPSLRSRPFSPSGEKDLGRIETRRALWISDISWMDAPFRARWPELSGVGLLERTREIKARFPASALILSAARG
jgi:hypothetical protein